MPIWRRPRFCKRVMEQLALADTPISGLPGASALTGFELVPIDQGTPGVTVKTNINAITAFATLNATTPFTFSSSINGEAIVRNYNNAIGASATSRFQMQTGTAGSTASIVLQDNNGVPYAQITNGTAVTSLGIAFGGVTRETFTSGGNVLIGTQTDAGVGYPLQVQGTNVGGAIIGRVTNTDTTSGSSAQLQAVNGSITATVLANSNLGASTFYGSGAANFGSTGAFTTALVTNNANRLTINSTGNVVVNAPSSGLNVALAGISAGTAALGINSSATTGAQTATWTAPTNKPGAASGVVSKWLPISLDSTTYYIPAWT